MKVKIDLVELALGEVHLRVLLHESENFQSV
jgi:hypothetical protein